MGTLINLPQFIPAYTPEVWKAQGYTDPDSMLVLVVDDDWTIPAKGGTYTRGSIASLNRFHLGFQSHEVCDICVAESDQAAVNLLLADYGTPAKAGHSFPGRRY